MSKQKEDKMFELKYDIADKEFLFDDSQLTERKFREQNYKKKLFWIWPLLTPMWLKSNKYKDWTNLDFELGQNFVKYFLGNGVSRKNAFEIYWPLEADIRYSLDPVCQILRSKKKVFKKKEHFEYIGHVSIERKCKKPQKM